MPFTRGAETGWRWPLPVGTFVLVALLALALVHAPGTSDTSYWQRWTESALQVGLRSAYAGTGDAYPPLTLTVFVLSAKVGQQVGVGIQESIKFSLWVALVATGAIVWKWSRRPEMGALAMGSFALGSTALGYTDIYFAPFLLLALHALRAGRNRAAGVYFTVAALFKWLPLVIAPFVVVYLIRAPRGSGATVKRWQALLDAAVPALLILALGVWTMGAETLATLTRLRTLDPFLSGNALNWNWIVTYIWRATGWMGTSGLIDGEARYLVTEDWRLTLPSNLLFAVSYCVVLGLFVRRQCSFAAFLVHAQLGYLCYFLLATRVHENHLFIAVVLGLTALVFEPRAGDTFTFWALALNLNLVLFYGLDGQGLPFSRVVGVDLALIFSCLLLVKFVAQYLSVTLRYPLTSGPPETALDRKPHS